MPVLREVPRGDTLLGAPERTLPLTEVATHRDGKVALHDHRTAGVFLMVADTATLAEEAGGVVETDRSRTTVPHVVADAEVVSKKRSTFQNL